MSGVRNKAAFYALYERGVFGNKLQTWSTPEALTESGHGGTVTLRYSGSAGGGWCAYDIAVNDVETIISRWEAEGADRELIRINESAPDTHLVLQGEIADDARRGGLVLRCSTWKAKMRDAMKFADHFWGVSAIAILRAFLTAASYEDVRELLTLYPNAVVEFSAYEMCLGDCRGRNAVVWEVRNY